MKIYLHHNGISMAGKAWEIRRKLHEYRNQYETVSDWIHHEQILATRKSKVILFQKK